MTDESDLALLTAAGDVGDPDLHVLLASRTAVLDAGRSAARTGAILRRKRRRRVLLISTAAATVAAVGVPLVVVNGRSGAEASAASFLRAVATPAGVGPNGCESAFWYSRSLVAGASVSVDPSGVETVSPVPPATREIWIGHHANGRLTETGMSAGMGSSAPMDLPPGEFPMGLQSVSWDRLCALPTDPGVLYSTLHAGVAGAGPDPDTETFVAIGDLLRESPAPPAVRAALYGAAAKVPGVVLVGELKDASGRVGTAVERVHEGVRTRYLIDPSNGQLLEEQMVAANGALLARMTYLASGPVADDSEALP